MSWGDAKAASATLLSRFAMMLDNKVVEQLVEAFSPKEEAN